MRHPEPIRQLFAALGPTLDERMRRLIAAGVAEALGHGGVTLVSQASGVARSTIGRGIQELAEPPAASPADQRIRRPGGGRKRLTQTDPTLREELERLIDPVTRGDPESPLRWVAKSTRQLAAQLRQAGHRISHETVAQLLRAMGYSLQGLRKTKEGGDHPDRGAQFEQINHQAQVFMAAGLPVVSVDAKKKELVGDFKNGGREWQPKGQPETVRVYDFLDPEGGKAIPYGVFDLAANEGWVSVGMDHDTAEFAGETLLHWWKQMGQARYPNARELMITADCGGSNSNRGRLWKVALQRVADETGLRVWVCHFPPGTSKWNKIEHRLFAFISQNWRGRPLVSHEVIVRLIGSTTTRTGLRVQAELDRGSYPTGKKVSNKQLRDVRLVENQFHGEWNYLIILRAQWPNWPEGNDAVIP
jgi:Rhodopirellula transposase DDE domain